MNKLGFQINSKSPRYCGIPKEGIPVLLNGISWEFILILFESSLQNWDFRQLVLWKLSATCIVKTFARLETSRDWPKTCFWWTVWLSEAPDGLREWIASKRKTFQDTKTHHNYQPHELLHESLAQSGWNVMKYVNLVETKMPIVQV